MQGRGLGANCILSPEAPDVELSPASWSDCTRDKAKGQWGRFREHNNNVEKMPAIGLSILARHSAMPYFVLREIRVMWPKIV